MFAIFLVFDLLYLAFLFRSCSLSFSLSSIFLSIFFILSFYLYLSNSFTTIATVFQLLTISLVVTQASIA